MLEVPVPHDAYQSNIVPGRSRLSVLLIRWAGDCTWCVLSGTSWHASVITVGAMEKLQEESSKSAAAPPPSVATLKSMTFALTGEDHTLGNALRGILAANMDVEFVGYSIPHPTQPEMNLRLQTYRKPAVEVLETGLDNLIAVCDHLAKTYRHSVKQFHKMRDDNDVGMVNQDEQKRQQTA